MKQTVYIPRSATDPNTLPKTKGWHMCILSNGDEYRLCFDGSEWHDKYEIFTPTHWLEKCDMVVMSDSESLSSIIDFAKWYSGMEIEKVKRAYERYLNEKA